MQLDLESLALILSVGLVFGQPLAVLLRVTFFARISHRLVHALGRKMNRERRPIATRAARGFIIPVILITIAAFAGLVLILLPNWLMALGLPASIAALPSYGAVAAMLSPQRFLWPLWQAVGHASHSRWGSLDGTLKTIASGNVAAADGHGRVRAITEIAARQCLHRYIGSIIALVVAGPIGLCIYRMVQLASTHYDGDIASFRGFHWASEKLGFLIAIPAACLTAPLLVLAGQLIGGAQPLRGIWRMLRAKSGISMRAWVAHSTHITLGGPVDWYGYKRETPWVGGGTAQLTGHHIARVWWWFLIASLLLTVTIAAMTSNFQAADFQHLFDVFSIDFLSFLSQKLHVTLTE